MSWRTFRRKGSKSDFAFPTVTIHADGTIALNGPAIQALTSAPPATDTAAADKAAGADDPPQRLDLLCDDETPPQIGFRMNAQGPYRPRRRKDEQSWVLSGSSFLRFVAYARRETLRFRATMRPDGVLAIDLRAPMGSPREQAAQGRVSA